MGWSGREKISNTESAGHPESLDIKNITKEDLKRLKAGIKPEDEVDLDKNLAKINDHVEDHFDGFISNNRDKNITLTIGGTQIIDTVKNIINAWNQEKLDALANHIIDDSWYEHDIAEIKNAEIQTLLKEYSFELDASKAKIMESSATTSWGNVYSMGQSWSLTVSTATGTEHQESTATGANNAESPAAWANKKETITVKEDYVDPFAQTDYVQVGKDRDIVDIAKDNKIYKYMENIFDDESVGELHKWTFRVNLSSKDGLAGIIIALREAVANKANPDTNNPRKRLYDVLAEKWILKEDAVQNTLTLDFTKQDLKPLIKDGLLIYTHEQWSDNELKKISKILTRAKRQDLDTFASLVQSKTDITKSVKELSNAQEMTGNSKEDKERTEKRASLIDTNNVLKFLCDFNSDGQISAEYKRKQNKEQKNQWDVGTLFGQQVMFTIDQAIAVKNIELGGDKGEHLVISNIIKNMTIADRRNMKYTHLVAMQKDPTTCTKDNLAKLINGNLSEGIYPMPEMKIFFLDAINKINGGSNAVQPDLYDTLVGKDAENIMNLYETEADLKATLDNILNAAQDPEIKLQIRTQWLVRVRETVFTNIMRALDHIEIIGNDGARTQLQAAGVEKWWETHALKKELLEQTIQSLILSGIHYSETGGLRLSLGYGKEWTSESGKTKRARWAWGWVILWDGNIGLAFNLSWEIAEQYNHQRVINADLAQVKNAKYVGVEWWALAVISPADRWVDIGAYAGVNRQQDPVAGINQIDKQYRNVSDELFDISWASVDQLSDKQSFNAYLQARIDALQTDTTFGKFVTKNAWHLKNNLDFMVSYMEANTFFGENGIIKKFPKDKITPSLNALLDIIQSGNIESRRSDIISALHGKVELTKLSFGLSVGTLMGSWLVTPSSPLSTGVDGSPTGTPPSPPHTWPDGSPTGTPHDAIPSKNTDRFWITGFYIGARISTWRNSYVPNEAQYLFTQHDIGQGIGAEIINNPAVDLNIYGNYLLALFNDPQKRLSYTVDAGKLILTFDPKWSDLTLTKFLNLHTTDKATLWFSLRGNTLTIGNVPEIAAYTVTEGKGVSRILCLGTKKRDEAYRVTGDIWPVSVDPMRRKQLWSKAWTKEKLEKDIITTMTGEGENLAIVKTEIASFFDAEGKLQKPKDAIVTFTPTTLTWTPLKDNGTLTIEKLADKTYKISFDSTSSPDALTITYLDQVTYKKSLSESELKNANRTIEKNISEQEIIHAFDISDPIKNTFTDQVEEALSVFDEYDKTLYKQFMESIVEVWVDKFISANNYTAAFDILTTEILEKNPQYDSLLELKNLMNDPAITAEQKRYIVDAFKPIFSYIINLTDGKQDGKNLNLLINQRKNIYKTMIWPDGESYPLSTDYRGTLVKNLTWKTELKRTLVENLIGFTAFYKLNDKGRKYAMTPIGGTNVLSWTSLEDAMIRLDETDTPKAQEWFFNNLDINPENKKHVLERIEKLLSDSNIKLPDANKEENIMKMLRWKEHIIQDISIDSFKKININVDWVFYLLGECGNESLGMNIKNISIKKFTPEKPVWGKYSWKGIPETSYEGVDMTIRSHSFANKVLIEEEKVSGKFFSGKLFGRKGKDKDNVPSDHPEKPTVPN